MASTPPAGHGPLAALLCWRIRRRYAKLAIATVIVSTLLVVPAAPVAAAPAFKLPFICGATYIGSTYAGHGWAVDFNQPNNADKGDPVVASAGGTVTQTKYARSNGQITITHGGGWKTTYAHMNRIAVRLNEPVARGRLLGFVSHVGYASTDHLHYEQMYNGVRVHARFDGAYYTYWKAITSTNCDDKTPPTRTAPQARFARGTTLRTSGASVPIRNDWWVSDALTGVKYSSFQRKVNDGLYSAVYKSTSTSASSFTTYVTPSDAVLTHRVRAVDNAGNWSTYATGPAIRVRAFQENTDGVLAYSGTGWTTASATSYSGGTVTRASTAENVATLTESGTDFAVVATKGPNKGKFQVYVDGAPGLAVDLYSSTTLYRQVVWQMGYPDSAPHAIELRVLGQKNAASTSTAVDIDAFLVLQT